MIATMKLYYLPSDLSIKYFKYDDTQLTISVISFRLHDSLVRALSNLRYILILIRNE